ncbi:vomeronasal receptor Vmn2r71 precursor [Mus musculus]|uniref:Vomeronasal 2, receptor 71 n=1 Tax=Mus musculus TaxID=10090 RepID=L7N2D8_MOUSE|nr:vomeronasal receptor Vmn2r71 precursor [Mus musculus]|eukprot:XP_006507656.1 PREDICTED: vomeronasal receptor Vmn2r71 isoform X1 [Mus musculus]
MFSLISVFWFLKVNFIFCHLSDPRCFWRIKETENKLGDKETFCLFSISTKQGYVKNDYFSWNLDKQVTPKINHLIFSVYLALEEINKNCHILPNISLLVNTECNGRKYDEKTGLALKSEKIVPNYSCTNERRYLIVLTAPIWAVSTKLGPFLYISRIPELYCGHFHLLLSDKGQFPHLYQISPKDTSLPLAMVSLFVHFRWNWIGVIITNDDHGIQFLSELKGDMQKSIVCLSVAIIIQTEVYMALKELHMNYKKILMSSAKVVIVYGDKDSPIKYVLTAWKSQGIFRIWVSASQFDMITILGDFLLYSYTGTFIFSHQQPEIPGFEKFIQTVHPSNYSSEFSFAKLWWTYFRCSLPPSNCKKLKNCPTKSVFAWLFRTPLGMAMSDTCYNSYNAIYAVAHSLHEMLLQEVDTWSKNAGKELEFDSWKMFSILKTLKFVNPSGDLVNMNQNLKQDTEYDIFYIMDFQKDYGLKMKIGRFSGHLLSGQQLYMAKEMMEWATDIDQILPSICSVPCSPGLRKSPQEGKDICCFVCNPCPENEISNMTNMDQCVKCLEDQYANEDHTLCLQKVVVIFDYRDPLGKALAGFALCFSVLTSVVLFVFFKHRDTPIVKANNQTLSFVLLISLIFCFICSLLYIGHPTMVTCIVQQITFAIGFTVATSTILAKTVIVVLAFKITVPGRRMRWMPESGAPKYIILICTMIQLILCGIWLGTSPPFVDADVQMVHGHIIIICNKGSVIAFYCVLGYMGSLALASFTVAFLARNLPDTFNEAKLLTFSMLVFCSVWITFIPVYHSTKGKIMAVVEVFCILASSAGLLLCIFAPKCYIILLRPQTNYFHKFWKSHANSENKS